MEEFSILVDTKDGLTISKIEILVKKLETYSSEVYFMKDGKTANARLIFNLMALQIAYGDLLIVQIIGDNEDEEASSLKSFLEQLL